MLPAVKRCYEEALQHWPELAGRVAILFAIEARDGVGRVIDAEFDEDETTLESVLVQACILDGLSGTTFPAPRDFGSITVRYPIDLRPKE
ncbi:hypothetical protein AKJ08_1183 [Vulgatibacter incomptus]|uniref:TonB C-terminal domain-containing protein n=1 Tax=Vulgatibacter incomptus TaxID=1391653 RepID=A0A0K1PBL6_9BACT|nr:hypothetical protein AKJ08_1183 [Vulgatibacter incomptus]